MEATSSSDMPVSIYDSTWCYTLADLSCNLYTSFLVLMLNGMKHFISKVYQMYCVSFSVNLTWQILKNDILLEHAGVMQEPNKRNPELLMLCHAPEMNKIWFRVNEVYCFNIKNFEMDLYHISYSKNNLQERSKNCHTP
jgi:hypothetical protein